MENKIGIYKIVSPVGKIYIGQSVDIEGRKKSHSKWDSCPQRGKLQNSFAKHGFINHKFSIVKLCSIQKLNKWERHYQDLYSVLESHGLNMVLTPMDGPSGPIPQSSRDRMVISQSKRVLKEIKKPDEYFISKSKEAQRLILLLKDSTINQNCNRNRLKIEMKKQRDLFSRRQKVRRHKEKIARDKRVLEASKRISEELANLEKQPAIRSMNRLPSK
jgi:group I intron endonuclease